MVLPEVNEESTLTNTLSSTKTDKKALQKKGKSLVAFNAKKYFSNLAKNSKY